MGYVVIIMFGLFESKEAKFWRAETQRTLADANQRFNDQERKKIAVNVLERITMSLKDIDGLSSKESKKILFEQIEEVAKKRRGNINELKYDNIKWNEEAMVECYLNMYCGYFGKKLAREAVMVIYWCRQNLTEKEINKIIKKVGLSEEKAFGSLL